ncbi:MAG: sulfatase-like hydrolase/transferase [Draconibacterium sp.]
MFFFVAAIFHAVYARQAARPNVVLIITDDQGYGDLGCTGNPHVKTPVLDRFAEENIRFTNFYVSPVCAPTRSSLMTGRYSLRTGVRDTYNGGSIMAASETTIAEMRGRKGSVYRGGVRVPFFMRYPGTKNGEVNATTAHIDVLPTIAVICGAQLPEQHVIDGKSLFSLITKDNCDWQERSLFFYWTRRYPELYNNMALYKGNYKLVGFTSFDAGIGDFEMYNIKDGPYEQENILPKNTDLAKKLKKELDLACHDLISSENIVDQPLIEIGNKNENPIILNRNEADGERGIWAQEEVFGKWNVKVNPGKYNVTFKFVQAIDGGGTLLLETNGVVNRLLNSENMDVLEMKNVDLPGYEGELMANYFLSGKKILPFWIELEKVD